MKIDIEISEETLKVLVIQYIQKQLGEVEFTKDDVKILVKSKQNYKSEWEQAAYKATISKTV